MGTWGTRIYEDDEALDIRNDFLEARQQGIPVTEIEEQILDEYEEPDYNPS